MTDLLIYAATPGGIGAALAAAARGVNVTLVEPSNHIGGLNTSGIGTAETENMDAGPQSIAGAALAFTRRVGLHYGFQAPLFYWEPKIAERAFEELLAETSVNILRGRRLAAVEQSAGRITALRFDNDQTLRPRLLIDASYEGDLLAAAGVPYAIGRESRHHYNESLAGVRFVEREADVAPSTTGRIHYRDDIHEINPFAPDGSLLPDISPAEGLESGQAHPLTMNYNFRLTMSTDDNRVPLSEPDGYQPARFELLRRWLALRPDAQLRDILDFYKHSSGQYSPRDDGWRWQCHETRKWELNNKQAAVISLGHFGGQAGWPDGTHTQRKAIYDDHVAYTKGLLWTLASDPAVPAPIRHEMNRFGYAADEYVDHQHWPYQLYVREARRMQGSYILTQHDLLENTTKPDAILRGTHKIDSHHVQRVAIGHRGFRNEGRIWTLVARPYDIPYRCLTPQPEHARNLLVPVALSASHVAFCSVRLEMVWMTLGHVAGEAAAMSLDADCDVQSSDIPRLQQRLRTTGFDL